MGRKRRTRRKHSAYNLPNQPGVYLITSPTGRYYIGRSKDMRRRCLAHQYRAHSNTEENEILCRSIRKYGMRMRYEVLLQTYDEQDAVYFEEQYIRMHWRDGKCMNAKVGDKITGDYNKDHKSKPVRYVHALTGGVICFDSGTQAAAFFRPTAVGRVAYNNYGLLAKQGRENEVAAKWHSAVLDQLRQAHEQRRKQCARMIVGRNEHGQLHRFNNVLSLKQAHGGAAVSAYYEQRACRGWLYRKAFEPWPTARKCQVQTIGIMIKATHVNSGRVTIYKSIMQAARELGVTTGPVYACLRGEQQTTAQHRIERYR
jgi:hypothetical protein